MLVLQRGGSSNEEASFQIFLLKELCVSDAAPAFSSSGVLWALLKLPASRFLYIEIKKAHLLAIL